MHTILRRLLFVLSRFDLTVDGGSWRMVSMNSARIAAKVARMYALEMRKFRNDRQFCGKKSGALTGEVMCSSSVLRECAKTDGSFNWEMVDRERMRSHV